MQPFKSFRLPIAGLLLGLVSLCGPTLLVGCGEQQTHHEEHGSFAATKPLKTDTSIDSEYVAQVHAIQHIELRAMERGYLQDVYVDEGGAVKAGQRMFQIMPLLYKAELQKAEAEVQFAEIEYRNTKSLLEGNVVSPNELAMAQARLDKAKAERSLSKLHVDQTLIQAPFDGMMHRLLVRKGSLLEEGELLSTLADNSKVWVYFNVSEAEYLNYQQQAKGDKQMSVNLRMANGQMFDQPGVIETIDAEFNHETGNIAFRATFDNPQGLLRHGETGKIILAKPLPGALLIPQKATFDVLDKKFVYVVDEENIAHLREITIAEEMPHVFVVASCLSEDDKVLIDGLRKVRDGHEVQIQLKDAETVLAHLDIAAE